MRVLVTGATGFIGSHAVTACLRAGCEVAALVLPEEAEGYRGEAGDPVTVFAGTLAAPPWDALGTWRADACLHCAWVATPGEYLHSPLNRGFLRWSKGFLQRLAATGTHRLVGVGSCAERLVGQQEDAPLYARCKDELRRFLTEEMTGVTGVWARLFYPYGIGEARGRLVSTLIETFTAGREFRLRCPDTRKDYIHVDDVATALAALVRANVEGLVEVGSGTGVRLGELAGMAAGLMACPELLHLGNETDPLGDMVANSERLRTVGWSPVLSLPAGLAAMVEHGTGGRPQ